LHTAFETLIHSYIENQVGIADHFLQDRLAIDLRARLSSLYATNSLQTGGTGNDEGLVVDTLRRSDLIYWLDREHGNACENEFLTLMDHFVAYLNSTCYTGITGYEFHFTMYRPGAFYRRHLDQFRSDPSRKYSMIIYLNPNWITGDGGQLRIYQKNSEYNISPTGGRGILFKSSELEHEVLVTNTLRIGITGWLKCN
jgi:SM-20-related protein